MQDNAWISLLFVAVVYIYLENMEVVGALP
jgi:hypothetical protein